jgi:hypothetical protein
MTVIDSQLMSLPETLLFHCYQLSLLSLLLLLSRWRHAGYRCHVVTLLAAMSLSRRRRIRHRCHVVTLVTASHEKFQIAAHAIAVTLVYCCHTVGHVVTLSRCSPLSRFVTLSVVAAVTRCCHVVWPLSVTLFRHVKEGCHVAHAVTSSSCCLSVIKKTLLFIAVIIAVIAVIKKTQFVVVIFETQASLPYHC